MFVISIVKFVTRQRCLCKLHVCRDSQQALPSSRGRNSSISASPYCDRTSRSDIIREKAKNKDCANRNRHVPSTTDRLSTGTVIFPMSKHIDYCLSQSDRTSRSDGIREKAKNKVCQSSCAKCHQSILNGHRHLPEVESHLLVPLPFRSNQPAAVRTLFAKGLKIRIVPIAISMCQVPPIDFQEAPSSCRGRNTSINVSPIPIGPAVRTLFVKRPKIRIVPIAIGVCQLPTIDSQ